MRNVLAFKKWYALLALLLFIFSYGTYRIVQFSPVEQTVIKKTKVNNLVNLYVTEVNAGATTAFSYRFYLFDSKKNDIDFMDNLNDLKPFLITSDGNSFQKVENSAIYISVKGKIFSFSNSPGIKLNDIIYSVPVYLTSMPF